MRNSKTIVVQIDLIFYTRSVILGIRSGLKNLFKDSSPLGDRIKNATTSNVHYYENKRYDVTCASN